MEQATDDQLEAMEVYNQEEMEDDEEEEVPDHQNSYELDKVKIKKSEDRAKKVA